MENVVNFEIAKLLKEKGFDEGTLEIYPLVDFWEYKEGELSYFFEEGLDEAFAKESNFYCFAPTIAEVVMWLYEKHGIWIFAEYGDDVLLFGFNICTIKTNTVEMVKFKFKSPTEAYEAAIKYCLEKII